MIFWSIIKLFLYYAVFPSDNGDFECFIMSWLKCVDAESKTKKIVENRLSFWFTRNSAAALIVSMSSVKVFTQKE